MLQFRTQTHTYWKAEKRIGKKIVEMLHNEKYISFLSFTIYDAPHRFPSKRFSSCSLSSLLFLLSLFLLLFILSISFEGFSFFLLSIWKARVRIYIQNGWKRRTKKKKRTRSGGKVVKAAATAAWEEKWRMWELDSLSGVRNVLVSNRHCRCMLGQIVRVSDELCRWSHRTNNFRNVRIAKDIWMR